VAGRARRWLGAGLVIALPVAVGALGTIWTVDAIPTWYRALEKPAWNPPDGLFGPVWTGLYLTMGVALWQVVRVWRRPGAALAIVLFAIQLTLNLGWSWVFFGRRDIELGLIEIALLHVSIVATILAFGRVRRSAALLLIPYLAWVSFAAVLNAEILRLNG